MQTSTQERLNALQDELDRILSAKKDITKLAEFDLDALVHLLSPELESTFKNTPTPRSWSTKNLQNAGKLLLRRLLQVRHKVRRRLDKLRVGASSTRQLNRLNSASLMSCFFSRS